MTVLSVVGDSRDDSHMTELARRDDISPGTLTFSQIATVVVPQAQAMRDDIRRTGDIDAAQQLRRQLETFQAFMKGREGLPLLAAEARRTEVLIGHLLGKPTIGRPSDEKSHARDVSIPKNDRARFRKLAEHESQVETLLTQGIVSRSALLRKLDEPAEPTVITAPYVPTENQITRTATRYGTILADPPWNYVATSKSKKLRGYSDQHYSPLTTQDLCDLPVKQLAHDESVLLLWTTMPFLPDALKIIDAWGFEYVTALSYIKADPTTNGMRYGVGYWFRGAAELYLVGKRKRSYRSQFMGLVSPGLKHSRKPDSVYEVAEETYPGPYLELFARNPRDNWTSLGNELDQHGQPCAAEDGKDIRDSIEELL